MNTRVNTNEWARDYVIKKEKLQPSGRQRKLEGLSDHWTYGLDRILFVPVCVSHVQHTELSVDRANTSFAWMDE